VNETVSRDDRWTAAHCRALRALFATCGARAPACEDDELVVVLASLAGQFAFHAGLLYDLLPVRADVDRDALVDTPTPELDDALGTCAKVTDPVLCALLSRVVVPRLLAGIEVERASVDDRADGPRARGLTLIARDLVDARSILERVSERLVARAQDLDSALSACAELERRVTAAGAVVGLIADPAPSAPPRST
jgi:hypothetical protein